MSPPPDSEVSASSIPLSGPPEEQLACLAASSGALRHALAAIAARILDTRAYEPLCYARLGDYARERAGLSARQLQDLARTHRALCSLPRLERALLANELPWSKARLLARVATPEDEETWIARAGGLPIRRLEEEVAARAALAGPGAGDPGEDPDAAEPPTRVTLRCSPAVREKWLHAREMAERVAGQRLRAEEAIEWITAEACSALAVVAPAPEDLEDLEDEGGEPPADASLEAADDDDDAGAPGGDPACQAPAVPLPAAVAALIAGLESADPFELDGRLRRAVAIEQQLDAAMAPLLRVVVSPEYEWEHRYQTLETYVTERLGMSASKARALLRVERAGGVCPELGEAFRSGRLSWVTAQCLVPLLLLDLPGEWRPRWVAWAARVTVRRLEADVERALLLRAGHGRAFQRCLYHPERTQDPIPERERQMCAPEIDLEATEQIVWRVPREVAWLFGAVREAFRASLRAAGVRAPSDGQAFAALLDHALAAWSVRDPDGPRVDPVIEREGYRCAVPGCSSRRNLHDHHIVFRSAGGSQAPENRIALCAFHHHRCLHAGRLRVRGQAPDRLVYELGVRAGREPLARYRSGDLAIGPREAEPVACRPALRLVALPA